MKRILILSILLTATYICRAQKNQPVPPTDNKLRTALDSLVHQFVSPFMKDTSRVGISIGMIKNGKQYIYNYGTRQRKKQELPTGNTVYELASITKTFTSTLLAQAVIEQKVKLNDDIRKYLKEKYPNLSYDNKPVTLVNLANLSSGLPNWMPDKDIFGKADPDSIPFILAAIHKTYSRQNLYEDLHQVKLHTVPGSVTRHCNTAAQLLGYILEDVYTKDYDVLLKTYFTGPLKMKNTSILKAGKHPALMAKGYDAKGRLMPVIDWEDMQVAAGIASSAADMLKYMAFQLDETSPAVALSHQPTFGNIEDGAIALNWKVKKTGGKRSLSHTGGSLGFSSYMIFYPDSHSGIVLLANDAAPQTQNELIDLATNILKP